MTERVDGRVVVACIMTLCLGVIGGIGIAMALDVLPGDRKWEVHNWVSIGVGLLSTSVSALAVYFVRNTLVATQEMVRAQHRQTEMEFRPLLHIEKLTGHGNIAFSEGENEFRLHFAVQNYGRTPAIHPVMTIWIKEKDSDDPTGVIEKGNAVSTIPPDGVGRFSFGLPEDFDSDVVYEIEAKVSSLDIRGAEHASPSITFIAAYAQAGMVDNRGNLPLILNCYPVPR